MSDTPSTPAELAAYWRERAADFVAFYGPDHGNADVAIYEATAAALEAGAADTARLDRLEAWLREWSERFATLDESNGLIRADVVNDSHGPTCASEGRTIRECADGLPDVGTAGGETP